MEESGRWRDGLEVVDLQMVVETTVEKKEIISRKKEGGKDEENKAEVGREELITLK